MIVPSDHAIERYQERVKPALTLEAAEVELRRLIDMAEIRPEEPPWRGDHPEAPAHENAVAWAYLNDTIVLPLVRSQHGYYAPTVLTAGGISDMARARRNAARRARKRHLAAVRRDAHSVRRHGRPLQEVQPRCAGT